MSSMNGSRGAQRTGSPPGYNVTQTSNFTPEMMELFKSLFSQVSPDSFTGRLAAGDEGIFNQLEAPALKQFSGLQGNLASRFSGMGMGARRSSGFQNTMNQAGSDFASQLQSQRMGLQQGAIKDLMSMSNQLLSQRPFETHLTEQKPGFLESILGGVGNLGGQAGTLKILKMLGLL